jgi:hypothetical protein
MRKTMLAAFIAASVLSASAFAQNAPADASANSGAAVQQQDAMKGSAPQAGDTATKPAAQKTTKHHKAKKAAPAAKDSSAAGGAAEAPASGE